MDAMRAFFGTDRMAFDIVSSRFPTQPRHFERFSDVLGEVIDARVWAGSTSGPPTRRARLGMKVAHWERKYFFQPARKPCRRPRGV